MKDTITIKNFNITPLKKRFFLDKLRTFHVFPKEYKERYIISTIDDVIIGFRGKVYYEEDCLLKDYIILNSNMLMNFEAIQDIAECCDTIAIESFERGIDYELTIKIGEDEYSFLTVGQYDNSMSIAVKSNKSLKNIIDTNSIYDYFKLNILQLI